MNVLFLAVLDNDLDGIQRNWEYCNAEERKQLLDHACAYGSAKIVRFLVEEEKIEFDEETMAKACKSYIFSRLKYREILKILIQNGARINRNCDYLDCAFTLSVQNGDLETVQIFLKHGFNPQKQLLFNLLSCAYKDHFHLFRALWSPEFSDFFYITIAKRKLEFALFIYEKCKLDIDLSNPRYKDFLSFQRIVTRTRHRAANKIISWWIPFCYNLKYECAKRIMEKSFSTYEKGF